MNTGLTEENIEHFDVPGGILNFTGDKTPKITYANDVIMDMLRYGGESEEWSGFVRDNFFYLIPADERRLFQDCMSLARSRKKPVPVRHRFIRRDGGTVELMGWLQYRKGKSPDGGYCTVYFPVPGFSDGESRREKAYIKALTKAFDTVIRINHESETLEIVYDSGILGIDYITGVGMDLKQAFDSWAESPGIDADREKLLFYIKAIEDNDSTLPDWDMPLALEKNGSRLDMQCNYFRIDKNESLLCLKNMTVPRSSRDGEKPMDFGMEVPQSLSRVTIRTFGYFDVFIDNKPLAFHSEKAKELLAVLVDRRGGYVSTMQAISYLWEDEEVDKVIQSRYRQVASQLNRFLKEKGISDIVENVDGQRRICPAKVSCDLFRYYSDPEKYDYLFKGSYMLNYSWGEVTRADLEEQSNKEIY